MEVDDNMPQHEYYEYFGPDYTLHVAPSNMENKNSRQLLENIRDKLLENLSKLQHAPSVQFQERPPDTELPEVCFAAIFLFAEICPSFLLHLVFTIGNLSHYLFSVYIICMFFYASMFASAYFTP